MKIENIIIGILGIPLFFLVAGSVFVVCCLLIDLFTGINIIHDYIRPLFQQGVLR